MKKFISTILALSLITPTFSVAADEQGFDEDNIILRFGVTSDIHQNGYYAASMSRAQVQEWTHLIDTFQRMSGTNADGSTKLDAILVNGDLVDGMANNCSNVGSFKSYGTKATQNFTEASHVAQGLWGTAGAFNSIGGGFGDGVQDGVKLFYSLGNHDEDGRGYTKSVTKTIDGRSMVSTPVYSADYFAAVNCGWQYNPQSEEALANVWDGTGSYDDGFESSYREYIADLIDYNTNAQTSVTAAGFENKYGVTLASADAKYDKFYGHLDAETTITNEDGIRVGNSHMVIDPNPDNGTDTDRIHFIAVELSQSDASVAWAKQILDQSVAENPNKPIFMITHYKMPNSMRGASSIDKLHNVIKEYPQVIIWGGHSHTTMHNDTAINSANGYVAVESATNRYLTTKSILTLGSAFGTGTPADSEYPNAPYNYPSGSAEPYANVCYVEVDADFNVRINRVDAYRSYSTDYASNSGFYSASQHTAFATASNNDSFEPVNKPVFIREPWDILNINADGSHLSDFNTATRKASTGAPSFPSSESLSVSQDSGEITAKIKLNAVDDGMVHMYVVELHNEEECVDRKYYTNFYYDFPQNSDTSLAGNEIEELEYDVSFTGLSPATEYTVKYFAVDEFGVKGQELIATQTTSEAMLTEYIKDYKKAGNVNTLNPDTNNDTYYQWKIGHTDNGYASFFQYELPELEKGEMIVSAHWRGFVGAEKDKYVKFVQYDTESLLDPSTATYNSITKSEDYINTAETIYSNLRVNTANGNFDTAISTNDNVERSRLTIDMTEAVKTATANGNKYFTFLGMGTNKYGEIQLPKSYKPSPQLIIKTIKSPKISMVTPSDGQLHCQENTAFSISADVTEGSVALSKVSMEMTNSAGDKVASVEPTVSGTNYTWNFSNGLEGGTYTALIKAVDALGYSSEETVTVNVKKYTTVTKGMNFSYTKYQNGSNFYIHKDYDAIMQYDLSDIPKNAIISSAVWHFGGNDEYIKSYNLKEHLGNLKFTKLTNTSKLAGGTFTKYYGSGTVAETPTGMDLASSPFLTTEKTISELTEYCTKQTQSGSDTIKAAAGYFTQVDMTQYVKEAVEAGEKYFGFATRLTSGSKLMISKPAKDYYRPMLEITYLVPVENHTLTVDEGNAQASVVVNSGDAVLILAAYDGNRMLECKVSDTVENGTLTVSMNNTTPGVVFKSFVWEDLKNAEPLLDMLASEAQIIETGSEALDGKKVILIGNSFTYYGKTVIDRGHGVGANISADRFDDRGYFYQLCKQNGADVTVTNWTWGGHALNDTFGGSCAANRGHDGHNHLDDLRANSDMDYDYVIIQPGSADTVESIKAGIELIKATFEAENPNAKFVLNVHPRFYLRGNDSDMDVIANIDSIAAEYGLIVSNWGKLVADIIDGTASVENAAQAYNKNTFIVSSTAADGYHPNMLSGYITTQMLYSAITREKASGENYSFCTDTSINSSFDVSDFLTNYYKYDNVSTDGSLTGDDITTFPEIFESPADMAGIQKLIDTRLDIR